MDIIPIQSLPAVSATAPAAARVDLVTTRAIEFEQHAQEDATYTPGRRDYEEEHREPEQEALEAEAGSETSSEAGPEFEQGGIADNMAGESAKSRISLFA